MTHRLVVALPASRAAPAGWPAGGEQARAAAEPALNAWVAGLLGDPRRIRADVAFVDADGAVAGEGVLRLDALGLGPLDVVALVDEAGGPRPELAELLERAAGGPAGTTARVSLERGAGWGEDEQSLAEAFEVARAVGALVHGARPLTPADLAAAGEPGGAAVDVADLRRRADAVVAAAGRAAERLADDDEALRVACAFGVSGPDELARRLAAVAALGDAPGGGDEALVAHETARIQAVLGAGFTVAPRLSAAGEAARAAADGDQRFGGDRSAPAAWLAQAATVRPGVERLQTVALYSRSRDDLAVAQLPFSAGERWVALAAEPGRDVLAGRTSVVICGPAPVDLTGAFAGLFVDEWAEVVPGAREVTGVACNVDEPGAHPPQAIVVAVAPPGEPRWGVDVLEAIVLETLELARLRAVTPEQLASHSDLEQILPAIYVGLNLRDDTVSTDFTRAMGA